MKATPELFALAALDVRGRPARRRGRAGPMPDRTATDGTESYQLQYKFSPGEVFRCKVTHLTTVETKIRGVTEIAKTRSVSTKAWKILSVDQAGNTTFTYTVEDASMWQQLTGRPEIRYDSTKDKNPPDEYRHVAETVGLPMGTITIDPPRRDPAAGERPASIQSGHWRVDGPAAGPAGQNRRELVDGRGTADSADRGPDQADQDAARLRTEEGPDRRGDHRRADGGPHSRRRSRRPIPVGPAGETRRGPVRR